MTSRLILASGSRFRKQLLDNAGIAVDVVRPDIDERAVEGTLEGTGATPEDVAQVLAEAKAVSVSEARLDALVIGSDQTLSLGSRMFHKPADMEDARRHLLALSGKTHQLNSAVAIARGGETVWRHVGIARLTMRDLSPAFIGRHLSRVGAAALDSVGAYQIEAEGIQLFQSIEGDHFTIVGLPLLPLLAQLRILGAIDG
ncbi:MAG: Maf-like protein [Rhizobiaceae bacterium]|nr:Maf-like protein [Rhizobiaceae bacterium]